MARVSLYLLGPPRLEASGQPVGLETKKAVALLAYLATTPGGVTRDTLVALLWPDADQGHGRAVLRRTLFAIRQTRLGRGLHADREMVGLNIGAGLSVDVREFESELAEVSAHRHPPEARCAPCMDRLTRAAQLYRGDFLKGFHLRDSVAFDDWQFFETERLQGMLARALERLAWCAAAFGAHEEAVETARRWLALDPLNEKAHRLIMLLCAWSGRSAAALRQYQECARVLRNEIGTEPAEETTALNEAIRSERVPPAPRTGARNGGPGPVGTAREERRGAACLCVRSGRPREPLGAEAGRIVAGFGGRLIHSLPGELLAVFGAERALEGSSEIALRAALRLREQVGHDTLGIGVATGSVELRGERALEGAAVRHAARLAAAAEPGQVLAAEAAARSARDAVAFVPLGAVGGEEDQALRAYEVQGLLPRARKTRGVEGLDAAMVGREGEYEALRASLEEAAQGRGRVALVIGEAGVGKSRLLAELRAKAAVRCTWLEGRCLDLGSGAGYWPFLDMLRTVPGTAPPRRLSNGGALGPVLSRLAHLGILPRARARQIGTILAALLSGASPDAALDAASSKQETFDAIRDLLFALARGQPLVLVLEDLHWADSLSLDLIFWLLDQVPLVPLLLVCIYRPEREHRCWRLAAAGQKACSGRLVKVVLRDLDPGDSGRLMDSLLPASPLPPAVRESVLARAQGNPFILEEVIRSLIDARVLVREGSGWRATGDVEPVVPGSVRDVILGRTGHLDARLLSLLQYAAVLGAVFDLDLLSRVVGEPSWVETALLDLEDRGFVHETRTVPHREYSFRHVLTQQAVYEAVRPPRRRLLHAEVARALEELHEDNVAEVCEALGYHHERAGSTDRAVVFYQMAGEKAKARHASPEAVLHLERAIGLLQAEAPSGTRDVRELELRIALGTPLVLSAGHFSERVGQNYDQALALCRSTGNESHLFHAYMGVRRFALARGDIRRGRETSEELLRRARNPTETSRAHMMLAEVLMQNGRMREAILNADKAIETHAAGDGPEQIRLFGNDSAVGGDTIGALALWAVGKPDTAVARSERGIAGARKLGAPFNVVAALHFGMLLRQLLREPAAVRRYAEEQLAIASLRTYPLFTTSAAGLIAWSQARRGDLELGVPALRAAVQGMRPAGISVQLYQLPLLAEICLQAGFVDEGLRAAAEGLRLASDTGQRFFEAELHRLRAELLAGDGDREPALAEADRALEAARRDGALSFELRAAMTVVRLRGDADRRSRGEAMELLEHTYARFTEGLGTADLVEARALLES